MTASFPSTVETGLVRAADLSLDDLLRLRAQGDSALDHCLRRVVAAATADNPELVAAFNAAPPRRR